MLVVVGLGAAVAVELAGPAGGAGAVTARTEPTSRVSDPTGTVGSGARITAPSRCACRPRARAAPPGGYRTTLSVTDAGAAAVDVELTAYPMPSSWPATLAAAWNTPEVFTTRTAGSGPAPAL